MGKGRWAGHTGDGNRPDLVLNWLLESAKRRLECQLEDLPQRVQQKYGRASAPPVLEVHGFDFVEWQRPE